MRTETINYATFEELNDAQKESAVSEWRKEIERNPDFFWFEDGIDTIKKYVSHLDFKLVNYSFSVDSRSDWQIRYTGDKQPNSIKKILDLIGWCLMIKRPKVFKKGEKKRASKVFITCAWRELTGVCYDYDFLEPFQNWLKKPYECELEDLVNEGVESVLYAIRADYEYQLTDEAIKEDLIANEREFQILDSENVKLA